jgi:hypothetical protein
MDKLLTTAIKTVRKVCGYCFKKAKHSDGFGFGHNHFCQKHFREYITTRYPTKPRYFIVANWPKMNRYLKRLKAKRQPHVVVRTKRGWYVRTAATN